MKMGESSLVISLPKTWVTGAGVVRGGSVEVEELSTGEIIVRPKGGAAMKREADISPDEKSIDSYIIDHYINGTDVVTISSKGILDPKIISIIYDTIPDLSGFEVTEASANTVKVEYLGGIMPFKKLFSRFALIATNYLKSLELAFEKNSGADIETIKRMKETDKLYHALLRNLVMAAESMRIASEMDLRSRDSVYYALLINNIYEVSKRVERIDFFTTKHNQKLAIFFKSALSCHKKSMEAWNKKNRDVAMEGINEAGNTLKEIKSFLRNMEREVDSVGKRPEAGSRAGKLKGMIVASEEDMLSDTLKTLQDVFYYIERSLKISALNCLN